MYSCQSWISSYFCQISQYFHGERFFTFLHLTWVVGEYCVHTKIVRVICCHVSYQGYHWIVELKLFLLIRIEIQLKFMRSCICVDWLISDVHVPILTISIAVQISRKYSDNSVESSRCICVQFSNFIYSILLSISGKVKFSLVASFVFWVLTTFSTKWCVAHKGTNQVLRL